MLDCGLLSHGSIIFEIGSQSTFALMMMFSYYDVSSPLFNMIVSNQCLRLPLSSHHTHSSQVKRYVPKSNGASAHGQGMLSTGAQSIGIEEPSEGNKMKSVLEMDDLSDFLLQAQLANKDFQSEREQ